MCARSAFRSINHQGAGKQHNFFSAAVKLCCSSDSGGTQDTDIERCQTAQSVASVVHLIFCHKCSEFWTDRWWCFSGLLWMLHNWKINGRKYCEMSLCIFWIYTHTLLILSPASLSPSPCLFVANLMNSFLKYCNYYEFCSYQKYLLLWRIECI